MHQIGRKHLAAERQCADARRDDDGAPAKVIVVLDRLARMQTGTDAYGQTVESLADPLAHRKCGAQRERGRRECQHEPIALRLHDEAAVLARRVADHAVVPTEKTQELRIAQTFHKQFRRRPRRTTTRQGRSR
jgi:hypothetical protein